MIVGLCRHRVTWRFCRFCKDKVKPGAVPIVLEVREPVGPVLLAKFDGDCPWCDFEVVEGESWLYKRAAEWVCVDCAVSYDAERR